MSTMKKLFALVLALAMIMSVSAFAYNDSDDVNVNCETAVTKLSAIGLFKGDTNGNFNPEGTLTRAEAATLIYRIRNNGSDAGANMWASTHPFTDVNNWNGGWAAGYIGYCYNYNIIIGRTATTFDPGAPVKGTEFAKMLLIAIGYKADAEGFNDGATWASKVVTAGDEAGLFKQYGIALSGAASRQWVAKMLDNALAVKVPSYIGDWRIPVGSSLASDAKTVGEEFLGFSDKLAVIVANDAFAIEGEKAGSKKAIVKYEDGETEEIEVETALDMIGQQVIIGKDNNDKVINVIPTGKTVVGDLTITKGTKDSKTVYTAKAAGKEIAKEVESKNIDFLAVNFKGDGTAEEKKADIAAIYKAMQNRGADMTAKAYDFDGNGTFDKVVLTTAVYGITNTEIKADTKTDANIAITVGDNAVEVKRNQVVAATLAKDSVVKLEVVDAKVVVTAVSAQVGLMDELDGTSAKIAGVVYKPAAGDDMGSYVVDAEISNDDLKALLGKDVVAYVTDAKSMIVAPFEKTETVVGPIQPTAIDTSKIAYVVDVQEVKTTETDSEWGGSKEVTVIKVKLLLANGTTVVYTYDEKSKVEDIFECGKDALVAIKDKVFEFVYDNGKVVIKKAFSEVKDVEFPGEEKAYDYDRKTFAGTILAKDSTIVFVKYTKSGKVQYSVMKMSDFKSSIKDDASFNMVAKTTGAISEALIVTKDFGDKDLPGAITVVETNAITVLVTGTAVQKWDHNDKDGKPVNVAVFKGINLAKVSDGEIEFKCANVDTTVAKGKVYSITLTNDMIAKDKDMEVIEFTGIGESLEANTWVNDSVKAVASNVILVGDLLLDSRVDLASGCVILKKNGSTMTTASFADITKAATTGAKNIVIGTNKDAKISMIIFTSDAKTY